MSGISGISSSASSLYAQSMKRPDPAEMFKKIDTDGDGGISQAELTAMAEDMSAKSGQTVDLSSAITTYDTDGDALLSQDEMGTMMMALRETMGPPPSPGSGTSAEDAASAYRANSGEAPPAGGPGGAPPPSPEEAFNSLDTNGDGVISQEELSVMFEDISAKTGEELDTATAVSTYDEDGDGALSETEMETMMSEMRDSMGPPLPPPEEGGTAISSEVLSAYQANSGNDETLATLLDLIEQYQSTSSQDSSTS